MTRLNLSDLLRKNLVEKFHSDKNQIKNEMDIAKNDLSAAKKMLGIEEWGWVHNAAYNAMLQAGRALMFAKGSVDVLKNETRFTTKCKIIIE